MKQFAGYQHLFRHPVTNEYLWKFGTRNFFPNVKLAIMKGKNKQQAVAFKTDKKLTKFEINQFLTTVYGLHVKKVNTLNYEPALGHHRSAGPKRIGRRYKKRNGFKKAYVTLSDKPVKSVIGKMKEHAEDINSIFEYHKQKQAETGKE